MRIHLRSTVLFVLVAVASSSRVFAIGSLWGGTTSDDWGDATNWNHFPTSSLFVSISTSFATRMPVVYDGSTFAAANISLGTGTSLTFDRTIATSFANPIVGAGQVILNGTGTVTLSGSNTYTGATTINAGTLAITGQTTDTAITVNNSGALNFGGGTIGAAIVSGTLATGLATSTDTGALTLQSGATTTLSIGGAGSFGKFAVTGQFTPGGTLSVDFANAYMPTVGSSFDVLDWGSLGSGTFATVDLATLSGGEAWDTSALYTTGTLSVVAAAVPEPGTWALAAGVLAIAVTILQRRRKSFQSDNARA